MRSLFVPWSEITDISITKRELGGAKLKSVCVNVLLRRWQQRYAKAPAAPEQPSLDPWPAG